MKKYLYFSKNALIQYLLGVILLILSVQAIGQTNDFVATAGSVQYPNMAFDLSLSETDIEGIPLNGETLVTVTSIAGSSYVGEGEIFNQLVDFTDGAASLSLMLQLEGEHRLQVDVADVTNPGILDISVVDYSNFNATLPTSAYSEFEFNLGITNALDVTGVIIKGNRNVRITSNEEPGDNVFEGVVSFSASGETTISLSLVQSSGDPGLTHTLAISIEGITEQKLQSINIINNPSSFSVVFIDGTTEPEIKEIIAGTAFSLRIKDAEDENNKLLSGTFDVKVTSDRQDEIIILPVSFTNGIGRLDLNVSPKTLFIAGLHTLTIDIPAIKHTEQRTGLTIIAESLFSLTVKQHPSGGQGTFNGLPVLIDPIVLNTVDRWGNVVPTDEEYFVYAELVIIDPVDNDAVLSGPGSTIESALSILNGDSEVVFNNLFINRNGIFRLRFRATQFLTEANTNQFTMTQMEDLSGFTIMDPGPQVLNAPFTLELENAQTYNGTLLNGDYTVQVENVTDNTPYTAVTVPFTQGRGSIADTIALTGEKDLNVTITGIGVSAADVIEGPLRIPVVAADQSTFTITDPGAQVAGSAFTLELSGASDVAGLALTGEHQVMVNAADEGQLFSGAVAFDANGAASITGLVLNNSGDQMVTVTIDGVTDPQSITLSVNPGIRITDSNGNTVGPNDFVFPSLVEGYTQEDAKAIAEIFTISLLGSTAINNLSITAPNGFTADAPSSTTLDTNTPTATFSLTPNTGHTSPGLMDSVVAVSYDFDLTESDTLTYRVDFPVDPVPLTYSISIAKFAEPEVLFADNHEVVMKGSGSLSLDLSVINTGTGTINNLSVYLSGANATSFTLSQPVSSSLEVSGSTTFGISLKPGGGTYTANVNVTADNDMNRIFKVTFTRTTSGLVVSLNPADPLFLGTFSAGYSIADATQTITITNTGTTDIASYTIELNGADFTVDPISGGAIPSGETATFMVSPAAGQPNNTFVSDVITVTATDGSSNTTSTLPVRFLVDQMQWQGGINTNWSQAENWIPATYSGDSISKVPATVPNRHASIVIPEGAPNPVISSLNIRVKSLEIQSGAQLTVSSSGILTIDAGGSLVVKSDDINPAGQLVVSSQLVNNGTLTLENTMANGGNLTVTSSGRLTSNGTMVNAADNVDNFVVQSTSASASGSVILNNSGVYGSVQRWMDGSIKFQAVSAPVIGQNISDFVADFSNDIAISSTNQYIAIRTFDEGSDSYSAWSNVAPTGDFLPAKGYVLARATAGPVTFKGELRSSQQTYTLTRSGPGWNLLGNPFPSSLGVKDVVNGFLNPTNVAQLDPNFAAVYFYDDTQAGGSYYFPVNNATSGYNYAANGQGFFVRATTSPSAATFATGMRTHQLSAAMFKEGQIEETKLAGWQRLGLSMMAGNNKAQTLLAFNPYMTSGLDVSYDAGMYSGNQELDFQLYSQMPLGESTLKMGIQALPDNNYNQLMVPLGVLNKLGGSVEFAASMLELQSYLSPLLYDKQEDIYTDLTQNSYTATIADIDPPTGRFFVRMQDSRNEHTVQFEVDGMGGELLGTTGETVLDNGQSYGEGIQLVFTALPWQEYKVYQWTVNGTVLNHTAEELKIRLLEEVNITVSYTAADKQDDILLDADDAAAGKWEVYFAHGEIVIQGNMGEGSSVIILDVNGRSLLNRNLHEGPVNTIAAGALSGGIYFVKVTHAQNVETKRLYIR